MPLTRKGVTYTDALLEAAAIARVQAAVLNTFELRHPLLVEPLRFVANTESFFATLEADAPDNAGEEVEFIAAPARLRPPEESDAASAPEVVLEIDGISGAVTDRLKQTRGSLAPWVLIERVYVEGDTSGPAKLPPMRVELSDVHIESTVVALTFSFGDPGNMRVPALTFNRIEYPGLGR